MKVRSFSHGRLGKGDSTLEQKETIIVSAIQHQRVLKFLYNGLPRVVEPQTFGISTAGHSMLRAYQAAGKSSGSPLGLRLFEVSKIFGLEMTSTHFPQARPEHNPQDSAMSEVRATLPLPSSKS